MTNTQGETVAKAVDGGKLLPCPLCGMDLVRAVDPRMSGMLEHPANLHCPISALCFLDTEPTRESWNRRASPAPSQYTGWSEEAVAQCDVLDSCIESFWCSTSEGSDNRLLAEGAFTAVKAIRALAASSISPATGFEVNKLQWYGDFNSTAYADSVFGKFAAWIIGGSAYVRAPWFDAGGVIAGRTKEDAEAAAIKLITERIRSSISPTVTAKDGEAWQHIASAPECDWTRGEKPTDAILYSPQFGVRTGTVCSFRGETYGSVSNLHGNAVTDWGATHWQPLPTPPAKDTQP